jgi:hypothetical protein
VRTYLLIVFLPIATSLLRAQEDTPSVSHSMLAGLQGGFIAPHREQMTHLIRGHSVGGFMQWIRQTDGSSAWHQWYNYPETGLDLFFNYTGNSRQLGNQMGMAYFLNLPLIRATHEPRKFRHWIGLGIGLGYSTKIWDLETNHQANVLGSHFNASLLLSWSSLLINSAKFNLRCGLRLTHFSNGAYQIPNLGTNNVALFLSGGIVRDKKEFRKHPITEPTEPERMTTSISISGGIQEVPPPTFPKYPVMTASVWEDYRYSWRSSVTAGIDLFYKPSLKQLFKNRDHKEAPETSLFQAGALLGYTMYFNDFELKMQQGIYVYDKWKDTGLFYHRFGLRYRITNHLIAHLMLKTHFAKADHGELGLGYSF